MRDWIRSLDCPYFYRESNGGGVCTYRYRATCGCKQNGVPSPMTRRQEARLVKQTHREIERATHVHTESELLRALRSGKVFWF